MPDLENNIDELFRKAAGNYPLKTGESNWDDIASQLSDNPDIPAAAHKKNDNKKKSGLLLLLLFFTVGGGIFIIQTENKNEITSLHKPANKNNMTNSANEAGNFNKKAATVNNKQNIEKESSSEINYSLTRNQQQANINPVILNKNNFINTENSEFENKMPEYSVELIGNMKKENENSLFNQVDNNITRRSVSSKIDQEKVIIEQKESIDAKNSIEKKANPLQNQRGIYLGFVWGPAFNEVKKQGMNKPGYDIGIKAGYRLNSRISVETGFLFAKKYYFSNGKYFNMNSMPSGMKVLSLEGSSTLFEIPAKLKYDVLHKNRGTLFSSAGVASYIMTNEKNDYLALMNGAQQNMTGEYKKMSRYFAAAVDISLGYEYKIGKLTSIRIEPYIQIPLKGIGVGSMPVTSAGLHIGITRATH